MSVAAKAYSTIDTVLKAGSAANNVTKICKIKSYPDLGAAPDNLETTDLEDTQHTFVPGVRSMDQMEFTANYTPEADAAAKASANREQYYELDMGSAGAQGKFTWTGQHDVYVNGGDVNAVREMTIVVTPSSVITATVNGATT
jgi:hypothetical protein